MSGDLAAGAPPALASPPLPFPVPPRPAAGGGASFAAGGLPPPSRSRRRTTRGALLRRRIAVRAAKWLLPAGALALLAAVALWPEIQGAEERARISFTRSFGLAPDAVQVVAPRYQGVDEQNRPYNVTADRASQDGGGSAAPVAMERPRADLFLSGGAWALLEAEAGRYDRASGVLDLAGDVRLWHDGGTRLRTEAARIETGPGRAEGDRPVAAQGPFGTLTSEGFRLEDKGQVVVFTGRARAVLEGGR